MIYGRGVGSVTTLKTFQTWKTDGSSYSDTERFLKTILIIISYVGIKLKSLTYSLMAQYYENSFIIFNGALSILLLQRSNSSTMVQ